MSHFPNAFSFSYWSSTAWSLARAALASALSAVTGFAGKALTGQIPWGPALLVALAALPGAQVGAWVSRRLSSGWLRGVLFVIVLLTALRVWWDLLRP